MISLTLKHVTHSTSHPRAWPLAATCAGLLCLDGPYTAPENLAVTVDDFSLFVRVEMKIKTGATSNGDMLMLGGSTAASGCGNLFFLARAGLIGFGVQCNGGSSDATLDYSGTDTGQPNTEYNLAFEYNSGTPSDGCASECVKAGVQEGVQDV